MTLKKGQWLGPYEIENPLSAGGMGEVYLAKVTELNRHVALRFLSAITLFTTLLYLYLINVF